MIPGGMARWEKLTVAVIVGVCVVLGVAGRHRKINKAYEQFLELAPRIEAAARAFAADHGGAFPPDGIGVQAPPGLSPRYIRWQRSWNIDYEAHPNGKGGMFICLEFCGPFKHPRYLGLCRKPELRRRYPRGEPIPGCTNRIWVIAEQARVWKGR